MTTMTYELVHTVPRRLQLRINERFGGRAPKMFSRALDTLDEAQNALGFTLKGFVASSGRSLVAEVEMNGMTGICKVPFVDAEMVVEAIINSAEDLSGPEIIDSGDRFVIMSKIEGEQPTKIDHNLIQMTVLAAERRTMQKNAHTFERMMSTVLSECARRATRSAHVESYAELLRLNERIQKDSRHLQTFQCHGDSSVRNMIDTGDRIYLIDPEPVIAPVELDVAKMLTFGSPLDIDEFERGELSVVETAHRRLAPLADDLRKDDSLDDAMIENLTKFFLIVRGISSSAFSAYERQINW